jgi:hypothetical protein
VFCPRLARLLSAASLWIVLISVFSVPAISQTGTNTGVGFPPFGSFTDGDFDTINEGNLNVHFSIPIFQKSGRGLPLSGRLIYDSLVWTANAGPHDNNGNALGPAFFWPERVSPMGWYYVPVTGCVSYTTRQAGPTCSDHRMLNIRENYAYHDPEGTTHVFGGNAIEADCSGNGYGFPSTGAQDASGYSLTVDSSMTPYVVGVNGTLD